MLPKAFIRIGIFFHIIFIIINCKKAILLLLLLSLLLLAVTPAVSLGYLAGELLYLDTAFGKISVG
jgi:hypothetical protein